MENIRGEFTVELAGQERTLKCTGGAMDGLEDRMGKAILRCLREALEGAPYFKDVVTVIHAGLVGNNDKRLSRLQIADAITEAGLNNVMPVYIDFLSYSLTGGKTPEVKDEPPGE